MIIQRRQWLLLSAGAAVAAGWWLPGCKKIELQQESPGLPPLRGTQETVGLEVISIRFDPTEIALLEPIWQQIDELKIPVEIRQRMYANGLRAGVLHGTLPSALEKHMQLAASESADPDDKNRKVVDEKSPVTRHFRHTQSGRPFKYLALGEGSPLERLTILASDTKGNLTGGSYRQVAGILSMIPTLKPDGRLLIVATPELEHGEARQRFVPHDGGIQVEMAQDRKTFENLQIPVELGSGEAVLFGSVENRPLSIGAHFFQPMEGEIELRRLLMVRFVQSQESGLTTETVTDSPVQSAVNASGS